MASKSSMKGFYRQKKAIAKTPKASSSKKKSPPKHAAAIGSDVVQPPALISHGSLDLQDDYDEKEQLLKQFDMNMVYGPCLGMTRMARWERAQGLGLSPPKEIELLLKTGKARADCLWDGRV
ncbi:DNA polymerase delta subunit 4 isoform X2 [Tripterygium wilfordii]|uniref:DNA polymerase delta subunit 4 isoform X2 n=1 Tax=Tripterygium wilfordii TaxID=458696 RepID=UPI0018F8487E|nr:DNA polymerase delta subunit 4 isoform X2 [Tripterygium wilfordii]